jgi:hypothetical protein
MNINSIKIQKFISPALTLGLGGYQTYQNYTAAPPKDKKNILIRDIIVLSGCISGIGAAEALRAKVIKPQIIAKTLNSTTKSNNFINCIKNSAKATTAVLKECLSEAIITTGGICGGLSFSLLAEKLFPLNNKKKSSKEENTQSPNYNLLKNPDNGVEGIAKAYAGAGINIASSVDAPLAAMSAYSVTQEKGLENKLKRISYELIANTIIPTFTITTTAKAVQKINNWWIKSAAYGAATLTGLFIGHHAGTYFNEEVTEEVADGIKDGKFKPKKIKKAIIKKLFD